MPEAAITDRDRALAQRCVECPVCNRARRKQRGLAFRFVKEIENGVCPFCQAYERVYGRKAHEPADRPQARVVPIRRPAGPAALIRRLGLLPAITVVLMLAVSTALRPWYLRWGATAAEVQRQDPGDELVFASASQATRAITIQAPPEQVWPWIVQVGEDRAGFYSYTWLENLFLADMHNTDHIVPAWQSRQLGGTVWLTNPNRYHGTARTIVAVYEPNHAMVLVSPEDYAKLTKSGPPISGAWTFILEPVGPNASRLIMRTRGLPTGLLDKAFNYFLFDPAHFIMERKMMVAMKEHAERTAAP